VVRRKKRAKKRNSQQKTTNICHILKKYAFRLGGRKKAVCLMRTKKHHFKAQGKKKKTCARKNPLANRGKWGGLWSKKRKKKDQKRPKSKS